MGEADGCCRHKPLSLQRCTQCGSPKPISHHVTRGGIFTPGWSPLLPLVGVSLVPLEAAPQVPQAALGSRVWLGPTFPHHQGMELGSAGADGATHTVPIRNLHKEGYGSPGTEGFMLVPRGRCLPTNLLLHGWGTEAAAQLTVGRDWIQFLSNKSATPIQGNLVFIMFFS